jgi:MarR family transcriptional regulator, organic hydroperoxide resistance regulator
MTDEQKRTKSDEELTQEIAEAYHETFDSFYVQPSKLWLELKLTLPQWKTLVLIAEQKSSTIGFLAKRMAIGEPTASHLVDKLVQSGLVAREEDPDDRRRAKVKVSVEGHELLDKLIRPQRDILRDAISVLAERDKKDILRILRTIRKALVENQDRR